MFRWLTVLSCCCLFTQLAIAQANEPSDRPSAGGQRHLLVVVGLPGEEEYRSRMSDAVQQLSTAAPQVLSVPAKNCHYLVGDDEMLDLLKNDLKVDETSLEVCTSASLRKFLTEKSGQWAADDSFWLVMIGHTQVLEQRCYFNVQGKDFTAEDLAGWLKPLPCRQQVNLLTMPASGTWLRLLKAPGRVNIAATDSQGEYTGTEFPFALANIMVGKHSHQEFTDLDNDGRLSLLDLYLAVTLEVHETYKSVERLPTEHAQLDDNGDGKAKEIQEPLIPVDQEDDDTEPPVVRPAMVITDNGDGALARSIGLRAMKSEAAN